MCPALKHIEIYTDGACKGNPGVGGWGALLQYGSVRKEISGGARNTTNNQMELTAVIKALSLLKEPCRIDLYLDSEYVKKGITEWIKLWSTNGWRTADKKPVKNLNLWQELSQLAFDKGHDIQWIWVKGHAGNLGNTRADALANAGIKSLPSE